MPLASVTLVPGVNVEQTPTLLQAGISEADLIRFQNGLVQKLGGWERFYPFPLTSTIRALHAWQDLRNEKHLAVGAEASLSVITDGQNNDITPRTMISDFPPDFDTITDSYDVVVHDIGSNASTYDSVFFATPVSVGGIILDGIYPVTAVGGPDSYTITVRQKATATTSNDGDVPNFAVVSGSPIVTVTLPDHGLAAGDTAFFSIPTTGADVTILGAYRVIDAPDADTYTISASSNATSTTNFDMNGGDAELVYYIAVGPAQSASGYSVGGYSDGGYSIGIAPAPAAGTPITAENWTMDNWGENLVACPKDGAIYQWSPSGGFSTAAVIPNAPIKNGGIFIAMPQQILVAWGSSIPTIDGAQDPLLIRWTTVSDYTVWTAAANNQAGSFRLSTGSRIVGAIQAPQQALIFTDIDLWLMQYVQPPFVFGFTKVSTGCGLVGRHAVGVLGTTPYWMSLGNFYVLAGNAARELPCSVWDKVFQDLDLDNLDKIVCAPNAMFNEVSWYYPSKSGGTGEIDRYVKYNKTENAWDYGSLKRTAWIDQSVLGQPIGADTANVIFQHEISNNADGGSMNSFFKTNYFMIDDGWNFPFIDTLMPDFKYGLSGQAQDATVQLRINAVNYPSDVPQTFGPYNFNNASTYETVRIRNRQLQLQVGSSDLNSFWRIGRVRFRYAPDGRR